MTADEKALVERLENGKQADADGVMTTISRQAADEAAALIRRQAEEIDKLARALMDVYSNEYIFVQDHLATYHAAALAIAKERA